jgi:hypothetical protein
LAVALGLDAADGVLPAGQAGPVFSTGLAEIDPDADQTLLGSVLTELSALHLIDSQTC